jgi:CRISPR type III-A-associated RAMP protein Csm4
MNPGLVIKLRPTGPWRIGPDSGARNQVDAIFHSDSLYSAVTSAMARLEMLEEWLEATARSGVPAVSFSSCFPFLDEIGFVIPPRTIWPPTAPAFLAARVRWKSARFVPLGIVEALLAAKTLDENQWAVDGLSGCLLPVGRQGPFRTGVRFNAAVDRLTGVAERHSVACLEFRAGAGLWAVASFAGPAASERWQDPLRTAFRLLADSGFGGERSRGWGRAESPEFTEGMLPEMILGPLRQAGEGPREPEAGSGAASQDSGAGEELHPPTPAPPTEPVADTPQQSWPEPALAQAADDPAPLLSSADLASGPQSLPRELTPVPQPPSLELAPQWLLSLFTPGPEDIVDWDRGSYSVLVRAGRVESPARSGELKKQIQMVSEGSVLYAASGLRGAAADVAPEGFSHPVFRAGFAVAIPLPEVG